MDPIVTGSLAKAADASANESAKVASNLLIRLLGPAADEYGDQLREWVARQRASRAARLLEKAEAKSRGRSGSVPPRVAYRVLEDGTLSDDELMSEYLSGVLAGSRSPGGRDDRAVAWSSLVSRMSSLELRTHYLLYREWATGLKGRTDLNLASATDRERAALVLDLMELLSGVQDEENPIPGDQLVTHVVWGLYQHGLIENFQYGRATELNLRGPLGGAVRRIDNPKASGGGRPAPAHEYLFQAGPTVRGIELWGWAAGIPSLSPSDFVEDAPVIDADPRLPRLVSADLLYLPEVDGEQGATED